MYWDMYNSKMSNNSISALASWNNMRDSHHGYMGFTTKYKLTGVRGSRAQKHNSLTKFSQNACPTFSLKSLGLFGMLKHLMECHNPDLCMVKVTSGTSFCPRAVLITTTKSDTMLCMLQSSL